MKPLSGEKTPVEIISRSESVLGPTVILRSPSAFRVRSSRSSSGALRSTSVPPCGTLVVYSISTFIRSPPGSRTIWGGEPAPHTSGEARYAVIPGTLAHDPEPQLCRVAAGDLEEAGLVHTGPLQGLAPLLPERAGDEGRVLYDAGALLGRLLDRGTGCPGVVAQVFFVVYEQRRVRIEGPLETAEGHPFVQSVKLIQSLRLVK